MSAAEEALEETFKVESSAGLDFPQASRQRSQNRPYKVRCPMCDTVGYVPRSSVGKEVRCANRDCLVPIFTAPRPEKKTEDEEERPKRLTPKNLGLVLIAIVVLGFAGWNVWRNLPDERVKNPSMQSSGPSPVAGPVDVKKADDKSANPVAPAPVVEKPLTVAEVRDEALGYMWSATQDKSHNRSRPLCERLTAHTAIDCGDLKRATELLEHLKHAENGLTFYRVPPLTALAWRDLKTGNKSDAVKSIDEAATSAADLPVEGAFTIDSSAGLAAAETAAGRRKEPRALADKYPATGAQGRLAAAQARAEAWNSCDIASADQERLLLDVPSLQLPLIVELAVAKGFPAETLGLAQSISDPNLKSECEVAWADAVERGKPSAGGAGETVAPNDVIAKLKPASQARVHAHAGLHHLHDNDRAAAETELKAAVTALGSAEPGAEFALPSAKEIYEGQLPDAGPSRQNGLAFAEVARLQAGLGQTKDADKSLATALDWVRASTPSLSAVEAKQLTNKVNRPGMVTALRAALKLRDNQVDAAVRQYVQNLTSLEQAADSRFKLEQEILDTALTWADPIALWKLIETHARSSGNADHRQPYTRAALPWQLMTRLQMRGGPDDEKTFTAIQRVVGDAKPGPRALLDRVVLKAKDAGPKEMADAIKSIENAESGGRPEDFSRSDEQRTNLILADRLVAGGQFQKAFAFAREIADPSLKEETMQWTVALATRTGQGRKVYDYLLKANSSFLATDKASSWRGLLVGLLAREAAEPAAASAVPASPPVPAPQSSGTQPPVGADSTHADTPKS